MNLKFQPLVSDTAVAMFKVASVIQHSVLKSELEKQAVFIASGPNADNISASINLVTLGKEVGEIKPINSSVLIKALETLKKEINSPANTFVREDVNVNIDMSSKFNKQNADISISLPNQNVGQEQKTSFVGTRTNNSSVPVKKNQNYANSSNASNKKILLNADKVYQYIVERKVARLKDLEIVFGEVSGRTIRRIADTLIKEGKIERIGSPGPASFYRLTSLNVSRASHSSYFPKEREKDKENNLSHSSLNAKYSSPEVIAL